MSDTTASLTRKISSAGDLQSVVRTMKALAASSIGQYDNSVRALGDYYRTVELGLSACFRESTLAAPMTKQKKQVDAGAIGAVVFGSDQGLVGQFNDVVADYAIKTLAALPGNPRSGPSVSAFMRAWQTEACRRWASSPCRIPSRRSRHSLGRFKSKAKRIAPKASMRVSTSSTTVRSLGRSTSR